MSETFLNQVTLDCLLNKQLFNKHIKSQKVKSINKQEKKFYRKRIYTLFKELLVTKNEPSDLLPDVKYAYDNFIHSCIQYFKIIDNNDIIQSEHIITDISFNINNIENIMENNMENISNSEADKLLMRSIKLDIHTLDKYVKRTTTKKEEKIVLPIQKNINLQDPELKNKGVKKKNITNKYEDNNSKKENETK